MADNVTEVVIRSKNLSEKDIKIFVKSLERAGRAQKKLGRELRGTNRRLDQQNKAMKGAARAVKSAIATYISLSLIIGTVRSGLQQVQDTIKIGIDFEKWEVAFSRLLGGAQAARKQLEFLKQFAAETPFTLPDVINASKLLEALDLDTRKYLETLGDVSSFLDRDLKDAVIALGAAARGEFENLKSFGVNIQEIAIRAGVDLNRGGRRTLEDQKKIVNALIEFWQERFGGGMAEIAKTTGGRFTNMLDAFIQFKLAIFESGIGAQLKLELGKILDQIKKFNEDGTLKAIAKDISEILEKLLRVSKASAEILSQEAGSNPLFNLGIFKDSEKTQERLITTLEQLGKAGDDRSFIAKRIEEFKILSLQTLSFSIVFDDFANSFIDEQTRMNESSREFEAITIAALERFNEIERGFRSATPGFFGGPVIPPLGPSLTELLGKVDLKKPFTDAEKAAAKLLQFMKDLVIEAGQFNLVNRREIAALEKLRRESQPTFEKDRELAGPSFATRGGLQSLIDSDGVITIKIEGESEIGTKLIPDLNELLEIAEGIKELFPTIGLTAESVQLIEKAGLNTEVFKDKMIELGIELESTRAGIEAAFAITEERFLQTFDAFQRLVDNMTTAILTFSGAIDESFNELFEAIIVDGKKVFQSLGEFIDTVTEAMFRLVAQMIAAVAQALVLRAILGATGVGGIPGVGFGTPVPVQITKRGGAVSGQRGFSITGGPAGPDTVPALLHSGEVVLPNIAGLDPAKLLGSLSDLAENLGDSFGGGGRGGQTVVNISALDVVDGIREAVRHGLLNDEIARAAELGR